VTAPAEGTVERWAWDYITTVDLNVKLDPGDPPAAWEERPPARRVAAPGRPRELLVTARAKKTRGLGGALGRARTLHTFLHHELQAAELMAWALLAFPMTPPDFRSGLARILLDETRHMRMYHTHIRRLGAEVGDFAVRDWFWERVPTAETPAAFVAIMGLGLESANLEHTASYAAKFRAAGDHEGARLQEQIGQEEIAHVRFGAKWFEEWNGPLDFQRWRQTLPAPLTPLLMRGSPLAREARMRAGQSSSFIDELGAWQPDTPGS
jgi:uncharacterized ferritin-like protein (DUF455 family)